MRIQFAEFILDLGSRQLLRNGHEVRVVPKAFDLLELLLERRPDAVSREEIRDRLWPDTFVSESTLTSLVTDLRAALDDDAAEPRFVRFALAGAWWSSRSAERAGIHTGERCADGQKLAIVRRVSRADQLEFPIGRVVHSGGTLLFPAVSPEGERVAFLSYGAEGGVVSVVDRDGTVKPLARSASPFGLAWGPRGDEVWYSESGGPFTPHQGTIHAVDMRGRKRVLARLPGPVTLNDVSREGRVLLTVAQWHFSLAAQLPGESSEKDMSWFDGAALAALSPDGRTLLFSDRGGVYVRRTDGAPAVRLGAGRALDLSPDGQWALASLDKAEATLVLIPTGAGETRLIPLEGLQPIGYGGGFFPDSRRIYVNARDGEHGVRVYVQGLAGEGRRAMTPAGFAATSNAVSPDGKEILVADAQGRLFLAPVKGGEPRPIATDEPAASAYKDASSRSTDAL